jgi:hypothetical protein
MEVKDITFRRVSITMEELENLIAESAFPEEMLTDVQTILDAVEYYYGVGTPQEIVDGLVIHVDDWDNRINIDWDEADPEQFWLNDSEAMVRWFDALQ